MLALKRPSISFEYFPPRTAEGTSKLLEETTPALAALGPSYFSVTYGATGSTRDNTLGVVTALRRRGLDVAPHLSFGLDDAATILELLATYRDLGVHRLVALRGDLPPGCDDNATLVHANELVAFIREHFGDHFEIEVAAYPEIHPEAESYATDVSFLKAKFDAGADSAITQYFYNAEAYFSFLETCAKAGIRHPVYPGIMPITSFDNLMRFSDRCGADIPRWLQRKLATFGDDHDSLVAFGVDMVSKLCETLLEGGAPGIHFYTLNQIEPTREICHNLRLDADAPAALSYC
jgi:methylenetetrahydrofolate reductase (NADPH)